MASNHLAFPETFSHRLLFFRHTCSMPLSGHFGERLGLGRTGYTKFLVRMQYHQSGEVYKLEICYIDYFYSKMMTCEV